MLFDGGGKYAGRSDRGAAAQVNSTVREDSRKGNSAAPIVPQPVCARGSPVLAHASVPAMPPATNRPTLMSQSVPLSLLSAQETPFWQYCPAGCDRLASPPMVNHCRSV